MTPVTCKTNLDLHHSESWPTELPAVPNVGDYIVSARKWGVFQLRLKVTSVTWEPKAIKKFEGRQPRWDDQEDNAFTTEIIWVAVVEMHDGWVQPRSINDFQKWYGQCQKQ